MMMLNGGRLILDGGFFIEGQSILDSSVYQMAACMRLSCLMEGVVY